MNNKFEIGDMVVLNSHPLIRKLKIDENVKLTSPVFLVKEILKDSADKQVYSGEFKDSQISDLIKYVCVYFDTNLTCFKELTIYESLLTEFCKLKFHKKNKNKIGDSLIQEVSKLNEPVYLYGAVVLLKTYKLELRKVFTSEIYPPFTSPHFILSGITSNKERNLKDKRMVASKLFKIAWFNSKEGKLSYEHLPCEFFTDS